MQTGKRTIPVRKSEFEYFTPEPEGFQSKYCNFSEYTPISALQPDANIEFVIPPTRRNYLDLSGSFLYIRAKSTTPNVADIGEDVQVGLINNTLHHHF